MANRSASSNSPEILPTVGTMCMLKRGLRGLDDFASRCSAARLRATFGGRSAAALSSSAPYIVEGGADWPIGSG
ncbi:hypothetical protein ABLN64_07480, partial [Mycobacterium tuberculosis]